MNLSLLIAVKNNLEWTKQFYETTRKLYPELELCFASHGSKDGTYEWFKMIQPKDPYFKSYYDGQEATFSDTYNRALTLATKDFVTYMHNDIILTPNFVENILKYANESRIVGYTTIEPPIFSGHSRPGKIIRELGRTVNSVNLEELYSFSYELQLQNEDKVENHATFFMCMPRRVLLDMGGLDNLFNPCFCEDDDLLLRFKLKGLEMITSLDAICYHFVSQTSRFSEEFKSKTAQIELRSNRNFIRKWGFRSSKYNKRYSITYVVKNCNLWFLENFEPWCNYIYVDIDPSRYIQNEQQYTLFPMNNRIIQGDTFVEDSVVVRFDASKLSQSSINILHNLQDIIYETNDVGSFKLDIFNITISSLFHYAQVLINKKLF